MPLCLFSETVLAALPPALDTLTLTLQPVPVQLLFLLQPQPWVCPRGVLSPHCQPYTLVLLGDCLSLDAALTVETTVSSSCSGFEACVEVN